MPRQDSPGGRSFIEAAREEVPKLNFLMVLYDVGTPSLGTCAVFWFKLLYRVFLKGSTF